jgi:hypothetical protein
MTNPNKGLGKLLKACGVGKESIEYCLVQLKNQQAPVSFNILYHDRKVMMKAQKAIAKYSKAGSIYTHFMHDHYYHGTASEVVELRLA